MEFMLKRLQEPSTYAGIAAFLASIGMLGLTETDWNQVLGAAAAVTAATSVFMREKPLAANVPPVPAKR
jgi:hypothetical protein